MSLPSNCVSISFMRTEKPADPIILNYGGQKLDHIDGVFDEDGHVELVCQAPLGKSEY